MRKKVICVVLTTRGNYAKMKSTMEAINKDQNLELQIIIGGGIIQSRFEDYIPILKADNFSINKTIDFLVNDGITPIDMAISSANAVTLCAQTFSELKPDIVIVIADRYESLAISLAAVCMNIQIAHIEGGELSGSIDEHIRHSITKLAQIHFPANIHAAKNLEKLGESTESIHIVGSPSLDLLRDLDLEDTSVLTCKQNDAEGCGIDFSKPYIVVSQHPVVTEFDDVEHQINETLKAIKIIGIPVVWLLPNMDAGNNYIFDAVMSLSKSTSNFIYCMPSLRMEEYAILLHNSICLVGNSSSGLRESEYLGVPVVNIGSRQKNRVRGSNVIDCNYLDTEIVSAIEYQIKHGKYISEFIYGDGYSGDKIAKILATTPYYIEKKLTY